MKISTVDMAQVPTSTSRSKYAELFQQMYTLNGDKATRIEFDKPSQATTAITSFKKMAKERGCTLGFSGAGDVRYFWVERPESKRTLR